jgi:cell division septum initiation protein DivIVA
MESSGTFRLRRTVGVLSLSILAAIAWLKPVSVIAQELPSSPNQAKPIDPNDPNVVRPTGQDNMILSIQGGKRLMAEANQAVAAQNYAIAVKKLQDARQVFNQLSNFYQDLAGSFSGIDNRIADTNRRKALETAQLRDEATYQLAIVHRAQNQPELAVPLLVQIVRSQQPTRSMGQKAYQQLLELGFVDSPYPRPRAEQPSSAPVR